MKRLSKNEIDDDTIIVTEVWRTKKCRQKYISNNVIYEKKNYQ